MTIQVADLCDAHEGQFKVLSPLFKPYGGNLSIAGQIQTIRIDQSPYEVRSELSTQGRGRILVVDAAANPEGAVLGDTLAGIAIENGWQGVIVNGYIRDTAALKNMPIGVWALGTCPRRGHKSITAHIGIEFSFGGVSFKPKDYVYADVDGIIISGTDLIKSSASDI